MHWRVACSARVRLVSCTREARRAGRVRSRWYVWDGYRVGAYPIPGAGRIALARRVLYTRATGKMHSRGAAGRRGAGGGRAALVTCTLGLLKCAWRGLVRSVGRGRGVAAVRSKKIRDQFRGKRARRHVVCVAVSLFFCFPIQMNFAENKKWPTSPRPRPRSNDRLGGYMRGGCSGIRTALLQRVERCGSACTALSVPYLAGSHRVTF